MAGQQTAKQHVVPKFYLRNFTNSEGILEVFDKEWKKFIPPKHPSGIGYDLYYYAQTTGTHDEISEGYEEIMHSFENRIAPEYGPICDKILTNEQLSEEDEFILALHASTMWLRGYGLRRQIGEAIGAAMKKFTQISAHMPHVNERIKEAVWTQEGRQLTDEEAQGDNLTHLSMISEYQGYTNLFSAQKMRIYIAEGSQGFITSDVPVMELQPKYATPRRFYGYAFTERLHSIPLSSQILLEFHDPDIVTGKRVTRKRISDEEVAAANARQLAGAQKWCAGASKGYFHTWKPLPGVPLLPVNRTGRFEESHLGLRAS
jgi:hypothetical protein